MGEEESFFPFIDPNTCFYNPDRPGEKLCPRCSRPGKACCTIKPLSEDQREVWVRYLRESGQASSIKEFSRKELWVCARDCDESGIHTGRELHRR